MKTAVTSNINKDLEIILHDNDMQDPRYIVVILGDQEIELETAELYRALIPFITKLTPQQAGTDKV